MAQDYVKVANDGASVLLKHASADSTATGQQWALVKEDTSLNMRVYDASTPGTSVRLFKAVIEIPYSLATLMAAILDYPSRLKWDRNIAGLEGVPIEGTGKTPDDGQGYRIFRSATKSVGPISGRDFVDAVFIGPVSALPASVQASAPASLAKGSYVNGGAGLAQGHPHFPESSAFVRGYNFAGCGWVLEPLEGPTPTTRIHYMVQSDLKGWLPSAVVNASLTGMFITFFGDMLAHLAATVPAGGK